MPDRRIQEIITAGNSKKIVAVLLVLFFLRVTRSFIIKIEKCI